MKRLHTHLLIIEDHDSLRFLLGAMLSKHYQVVTKRNGLEGLAWLGKNRIPDLILLDMEMPQLNGIEFIRHIKSSGLYRRIPIVVLSGNDDPAEIQLVLDLGAFHYLKKPFNPDILRQTISNALEINHERVA